MRKFIILPSLVGFVKIFVPVSHKIRTGEPNIQGFSKSSDDAYEHFTFIQWEKNFIHRTAISQLLSGSNRGGRGKCILVIIQSGQKL